MKAVRITIKGGHCGSGIHETGQVFVVRRTTPGGLCMGAWNAIAPYLTALRYGANFPWEKEAGLITVGCPDPEGITIELRRIEEDIE